MSVLEKTYRIYCYNSALRIVVGDWLDATNDEEAIFEAYRRGFGTKCEIWQHNRLVAELGEKQHRA